MKYGVLFLLIFIFFNACNHQKKQEVQKPNIVFILADDMGYGDLQCYNSESRIPTPNIDQLAREGTRFVDAHSPGAWCVPSRYGLMTGRYPGRVEMNWRKHALIGENQETLATLLKRNGYSSAVVGKWHLGFDNIDWENPGSMDEIKGGPKEKGFDYFFGMHASLDIPPYFYIEDDYTVQPPVDSVPDHASEDATTYISGAFWRAGAMAPDFKHAEVLDVFLDKAKRFVNKHLTASPADPFFLYFPLTAPHTPWLPKETHKGKSGAGEYGDFVVQVDELVGNVREFLNKKDVLDNTLFIFSSDNGPVWFDEDVQRFDHDATAGLKGMKIDQWEGGSRIPFIARWPGKTPAGAISHQLICFTDMMATMAAVAGDTAIEKNDFDSHNMLPAFLNASLEKNIRTELVIGDKIYREGNWKFIDGTGLGGLSRKYDPDGVYLDERDNPGELYDLKNDLYEQNNLFLKDSVRAGKMRDQMNTLIKK